jgi:hypothetical protein
MRHSEGIFLMRHKINLTSGSNSKPRAATWEPQPSGDLLPEPTYITPLHHISSLARVWGLLSASRLQGRHESIFTRQIQHVV